MSSIFELNFDKELETEKKIMATILLKIQINIHAENLKKKYIENMYGATWLKGNNYGLK